MFLKINESDWNNIKKAFNDLSMPLGTHQSVSNILQAVENQCKVVEVESE